MGYMREGGAVMRPPNMWHPPMILDSEPDAWLLGVIPLWNVDTSKGPHVEPETTWRPQRIDPWPGHPLHPDYKKGDQ